MKTESFEVGDLVEVCGSSKSLEAQTEAKKEPLWQPGVISEIAHASTGCHLVIDYDFAALGKVCIVFVGYDRMRHVTANRCLPVVPST
jgi:hypothetical protein